MKKPTYKFIDKLVGRITSTDQPSNDTFSYYGHLVELQSCMAGFVAVTIYKSNDRYSGEIVDFNFDYWTHKLHFVCSESRILTERIINAFRSYYANCTIRVSYDEEEYADEDTTYEYDETAENKLPVKILNKSI